MLLSATGNLISDNRAGINLEKYFDRLAVATMLMLARFLRNKGKIFLISIPVTKNSTESSLTLIWVSFIVKKDETIGTIRE
jgi:hypothetical protein